MTDSVGIIIVTHNRKSLLLDAIDSAKRQTYINKQIWVFDDASTDGTEEVIPRGVEYRRFRKPVGEKPLKRIALYVVSTDYVIFLDDDNFFLSSRFISDAVEVLTRSRLGVAMGADFASSSRRPPFDHLRSVAGLYNGREYFRKFHTIGHFSFPLFERRAALNNLVWEDILSWDMALVIPIALERGVFFYPEPVAVWYQHDNQASRAALGDFWRNRLWMKIVQKKAKELGYGGRWRWRLEAEFRYFVGVMKCTFRQRH